VTVGDLEIQGAITVLLKDALKPNLVQTIEGTPAFVHGGPFANIAHGCNSVLATTAAMKAADFTVTEAGFGADLGGEKFLDIKTRELPKNPDAVVIVATVRALKMNGGVAKNDLSMANTSALREGFANLNRHIDNIQGYGLPVVVAINEFVTDTAEEISVLSELLAAKNVDFSLTQVWSKGGAGGLDLAEKVVKATEKMSDFHYLYDLESSIPEKIETIVTKIYGGASVTMTKKAQTQIATFERNGWDNLPICMAKPSIVFQMTKTV
jgi:formate--tetrahydrofolate ligase